MDGDGSVGSGPHLRISRMAGKSFRKSAVGTGDGLLWLIADNKERIGLGGRWNKLGGLWKNRAGTGRGGRWSKSGGLRRNLAGQRGHWRRLGLGA